MQLTYQYTQPCIRQSDGDGVRPEPDAFPHSPRDRGAPRTTRANTKTTTSSTTSDVARSLI
eukprot:3688536-Pleurochrysis_carterae.AAC.1